MLAAAALAGNAKLAIAQDDLNAQNCSSIVKNVKASEGSTVTINIAGADCSGDSGAKLRVTYYWLDDAATGHLLSGDLPPTLRQAIGRDLPVVRDAVFDQVEALFDRFGQPLDFPTDAEAGASVSVCLDNGDAENGDPVQQCEPQNLKSYARERRKAARQKAIRKLPESDFFVPLPDAEQTLVTTDGWPGGYNFSYVLDYDAEYIRSSRASGEEPNLPSLIIWRPALLEDFADLKSRLRSYARAFVNGEGVQTLLSSFPVAAAPQSRPERESVVKDSRLYNDANSLGGPASGIRLQRDVSGRPRLRLSHHH